MSLLMVRDILMWLCAGGAIANFSASLPQSPQYVESLFGRAIVVIVVVTVAPLVVLAALLANLFKGLAGKS